MIQLARTGFTCTEDMSMLRARFKSEHCIYLRNMIHPDLLSMLSAKVDEAEFGSRHYDAVGDELRMAPNLVSGTLQFILNDESIFSWVRQVTNCEPVGCFNGRVYMLMPGKGHSFDWHDDCHDNSNRLIALSVNLGSKPYEGGLLELREAASKKIVFRSPHLNCGDAVMFRISAALEHRVTPVTGYTPKIAFAGWFQNQPIFSTTIYNVEKFASMVS
jgi:hypothetical protein